MKNQDATRKWSSDDLKDHKSVGIIIFNNKNEILIMDHVKLNTWIIPAGKVDEGSSVANTYILEASEELNITIHDIKEIGNIKNRLIRDGNSFIVNMYFGVVIRYSGEIINNEPTKHRSIKWVSHSKLVKIVKNNPSDPMLWVIGNWDKILNTIN